MIERAVTVPLIVYYRAGSLSSSPLSSGGDAPRFRLLVLDRVPCPSDGVGDEEEEAEADSDESEPDSDESVSCSPNTSHRDWDFLLFDVQRTTSCS